MRQAFSERSPELIPLATLLSRAGTAVSRHFHRLAAEHGLSPTALGVLAALGDHDGLSHRELAGRLGLTPATLTPVVDVLEAAGELHRERDPRDRRVVRLHLTDAGRERLLTTVAEVALRFRARMPHPPPEHEKIIRGYLCAVLDTVTGEGDR